MTEKIPSPIKEPFTTTLDSELLQEIKILAIRKRCSTNVLLEEAIRDLLLKYRDSAAQGYSRQATHEDGAALHEPSAKYTLEDHKK